MAVITIILLALLILTVIALVALARLDRRLPRVASILSRITMAGAGIWILALAATLFGGGPVTVTAPIQTYPLELPEGVELHGLTATIHSGGFDQVTVEATGLSTIGVAP